MQPIMVAFTPSFARKILLREKTIELRKFSPVSNKLIIFEKRPMMAIVAKCKIKQIVSGNADYWCNYSNKLCMSTKEIKDYLGESDGYGWYLSDIQRTKQVPFNMLGLSCIPSKFIYTPYDWFYNL
jgi:predicted transcriptional regulator